MRKHFSTAILPILALCIVLLPACSPDGAGRIAKTVTVAQSGSADVVGADGEAIQRAMDMLNPGDTLEIGPGEYTLHNAVKISADSVTVRGAASETVLKKAPAVRSTIIDGGDWGEDRVRVAEPDKFRPGVGVAMLDDRHAGGYYVVTATVLDVRGDTVHLSERSIHDLDYVGGTARLETTFPLLAAYEKTGVTIEGITADGNKAENPYELNGCRGGAIYLFDCTDFAIRDCIARDYHGDGISWQITDNIRVERCESFGHTGLGLHPGTGSRNTVIAECHSHHNGLDGLFLCYRVTGGEFTGNLLEHNGRHGISVGHKDSDNLFTGNIVRSNRRCGVYFRKNVEQVAGHRNVFRENQIFNNGHGEEGYGVYVEAENRDQVFENNAITETRMGEARTQRYGVYIAAGGGPVSLSGNQFSGHAEADVHDENTLAGK